MSSSLKTFNTFVETGRISRTPWTVWLRHDRWDDYTWKTQFHVWLVDGDGKPRELGFTKIGQRDQQTKTTEIPTSFDSLPDDFFSLGQGDDFYEKLNRVTAENRPFRDTFLTGMRDLAFNIDMFNQVRTIPVVKTSLLRFIRQQTVVQHFHSIATGGAQLTRFHFTYQFAHSEVQIPFDVRPDAYPPNNIHVVIGRNGVGKTTLLKHILQRISSPPNASLSDDVGSFVEERNTWTDEITNPGRLFSRVVSISFSAFDPFEPIRPPRGREENEQGGRPLQTSYVGLRRPIPHQAEGFEIKTPDELASEFRTELMACLDDANRSRFKACLELLMADPVFAEAGPLKIVETGKTNEANLQDGMALFRRLSSGHKIVWLTLCHLITKVQERTLVLFDEPEAHLHPPLLSAFIRSLAFLLKNRNAVAILATHSPVVLQEVPKSCVSILRRSGTSVFAERPSRETFAENTGTLTREVFGLEVSQTGYNRMISEALLRGETFKEVMDEFGLQVGEEGQALIRVLVAERNLQESDD